MHSRHKRKAGSIAARSIALAAMLGTAWHVTAQEAKATYSSMAPLDQYLMEDQGSEIGLARSAAPESISRCRGPGSWTSQLRNRD
jgi:hypothetical protein